MRSPGQQHRDGNLRDEFPTMSRATRPSCLTQQEDPEAWHLGDRVQVCVWQGWGGLLPYRDRGQGKDDKNLKGVRKRNEVNKEIERN